MDDLIGRQRAAALMANMTDSLLHGEEPPPSFVWLGEPLRPGIRVEVLAEDGFKIGEIEILEYRQLR